MPTNQYKSSYGADGLISAASYLVEFICERIAFKHKVALPVKFWSTPAWNKVFRRQTKAAHDLLKETDCLSIVTFLRSWDGRKIYSLGLKKVILDGCKKAEPARLSASDVAEEYPCEVDNSLIPPWEDIAATDITNTKKDSLWKTLQ